MNTRSLLCNAALVSAALIVSPNASANLFYAELNYGDLPGDLLLMDAAVSWSARTYRLTPLAWGGGSNLAGSVSFIPAGLQADLAAPNASSLGMVGIAFEGNAGVASVFPTAHYFEPANNLFTEDRTLVVRSWAVGTHTHVGVWSLNKPTGQWIHHVTFDSPAPVADLGGGTKSVIDGPLPFGFARPDTMLLSNGWKRFNNGDLNVLTTGDGSWYTGIVSHSVAHGGHENDASYIEMWEMNPPVIKSVLATTDGQTTWVSWNNDEHAGPQYSYRVDLLEDGMMLGRIEGIGPHIRRVQFDDVRPARLPGHRTARVSIVDIVDTASIITRPTVSALVTRTARRPAVRLQTVANSWLETLPQPSSDGGALQVTSAPDAARQSWDVMPLDATGWFELRSIASGRCAQVTAGTRLVEHDCNGIDAQSFYMPSAATGAPSMLVSKALAPAAFALLQTGADGQVSAASTAAFLAALQNRNACVGAMSSAGTPDALIVACDASATAWRVTEDGQP